MGVRDGAGYCYDDDGGKEEVAKGMNDLKLHHPL